MYIFLFFLLTLVVVTVLLNRQTTRIIPAKTYHFTKKDKVMTVAESRFYASLSHVIGDRFFILPQAHLSTFVDHKIKGQNWKAAFSIINGKSVDFLLVEKETLRPAAAIELDDWSHNREDRVQRDEKVASILKEAGVLFVRFDNPDVDEGVIVSTFQEIVNQSSEIRK
ncbi:MAG TPA: DUF2726 domain-containing protein [Candidatus Chromulinivoraceae bacterium]|nr:DUF2726 domain-containing protein [Candidatus Chromulinivoraceae bacterium]